MWRSTFVPETIFRRTIHLKQTDRTCWTIQTHSDEINWARRRNVYKHNSLSFRSSHEKFDVWPRPRSVSSTILELLEFTLFSNKELKPSMIKFNVAGCMSHTGQFSYQQKKTMKTIYDIAAFWWVFRSMYIINIVSTYLTQFSLSLYIKKYNIKGKIQKKGKSLRLSAISTPSLCTTAPLPFDFFWRLKGGGGHTQASDSLRSTLVSDHLCSWNLW